MSSSALRKPKVEDQRLFPYDRWYSQLNKLADQYQTNQPCPHIYLPNFFEDEVARTVAGEFPGIDQGKWVQWKHYNENKVGKTNPKEFPEFTRAVFDELLSPEFVAWLSKLTGIPNLLSDPDFDGGGLHQSERGGFLNIHTDYTSHYYRPKWQRRVNLLVYLNEGWQDSWGGHLEFWDKKITRCVTKYAPVLNHSVIFTTNKDSPHGHPEPMTCPVGVKRRSIALYYFTEAETVAVSKATNYLGRPDDGFFKKLLIWTDKQMVRTYSWMKRRFGLSDRFISKVLAIIFPRRK